MYVEKFPYFSPEEFMQIAHLIFAHLLARTRKLLSVQAQQSGQFQIACELAVEAVRSEILRDKMFAESSERVRCAVCHTFANEEAIYREYEDKLRATELQLENILLTDAQRRDLEWARRKIHAKMMLYISPFKAN